jgi:hypothetical protein
VGQALGAACWSVAKEQGKRQQQQQQRGTKRRRAGGATPDASEAGTEDMDDAAAAGPAQQQLPPPGKPLPVGSRPAWLQQVLSGGSKSLNKRHARALPDDGSTPQAVEFMPGCVQCDYQQVRSGAGRGAAGYRVLRKGRAMWLRVRVFVLLACSCVCVCEGVVGV